MKSPGNSICSPRRERISGRQLRVMPRASASSAPTDNVLPSANQAASAGAIVLSGTLRR
jgi:hypothetical protein